MHVIVFYLLTIIFLQWGGSKGSNTLRTISNQTRPNNCRTFRYTPAPDHQDLISLSIRLLLKCGHGLVWL